MRQFLLSLSTFPATLRYFAIENESLEFFQGVRSEFVDSLKQLFELLFNLC